MTTPDRDPVATAQGLTDALTGMAGELNRLGAYGKRNRRLIWFTIVSLAVDVALTVVVGLLAVQSHHASVTAQHASASNLALCQAGNTARAQNRELWDHLIQESLTSAPRPGETPAQRAQAKKELDGLRSYVNTIFGSRNCSALGKKDGS
jgi:hypothetical protein